MSFWQKVKCRIGIHKKQDIPLGDPRLCWTRCYMCGRQFGLSVNKNLFEEAPKEESVVRLFDEYKGPY